MHSVCTFMGVCDVVMWYNYLRSDCVYPYLFNLYGEKVMREPGLRNMIEDSGLVEETSLFDFYTTFIAKKLLTKVKEERGTI